MPNPENLIKHRYKKGESGNPGGRPRGTKSLFKTLQKSIEEGYDTLLIDDAEIVNEKGEKTGKKVNVSITLPGLDAMVVSAKKRMLKSDKLWIDYLDRTEGRAKQVISLKIEADDFHPELLCSELMDLTEYIFTVASDKKESDKKELIAITEKLLKKLNE